MPAIDVYLTTVQMLAACLLFGSVTAEDSCPSGGVLKPFNTPLVRWHVQRLAVAAEVLDERGTKYTLNRDEHFTNDLCDLRRVAKDLADAPRLAAHTPFPDREYINELATFNREYRHKLNARMEFASDKVWYEAALNETDYIYRVLDNARDAKCDYYYVQVRRGALKNLAAKIDAEAFMTGELPPCVPVWRLSTLR